MRTSTARSAIRSAAPTSPSLNGTHQGEHFDSLTAHAAMTSGAIDDPSARLRRRTVAHRRQCHLPPRAQRSRARHISRTRRQQSGAACAISKPGEDRPGLRGALTLNADAAGQVAGRRPTDCAQCQRGDTRLGNGRQAPRRPHGHRCDLRANRRIQRELRFRRLHDSRQRPLAAHRQARHHRPCGNRQSAHRPRARRAGAARSTRQRARSPSMAMSPERSMPRRPT